MNLENDDTTDEIIEASINDYGFYYDGGTKYSGCCSAVVYDGTDICSECKEHL